MYDKKLFLAIFILHLLLFAQIVHGATSVNTAVYQSINSGSLTINGPDEVALNGTFVASNEQHANGTISSINVNDERGNGFGWSASLTVTNLTFTKQPAEEIANSSPLIALNSTSRYDGSCGVSSIIVRYEVTVVTGGPVGNAKYSVTGGCNDENQIEVITASTANAIGTRGVLVDFPAGTYVAGDKWTILVDVYPFTGLKVTPQLPTAAVEGSDLSGLTEGTEANLSGGSIESSSMVILTADADKGMGSYNQDVDLELTVHPRSLAGDYSGTITLTVI